MQPVQDVKEIARIAYGFMGSKALFAALNLGLLDQLSEEPRSLQELAEATGRAENLLEACLPPASHSD